ncbi:helix-turn-helix domain-containing protein [Stutzerimonas xanthomarina]|uniref:helix-turn-helix domain-containing protein n=1 Tax=Stutzerimonas xanthomarina TaxID=271420 RepID=UPI003AA90DDB
MTSEREELDPFNIALGGVLRDLRLKCGLAGDDVVRVVTRANLHHIESGAAQVGLSALRELCRMYGVSASHVIAVAEARSKRGGLRENVAKTCDELKASVAAGRFDPMSEAGVEHGLKALRKAQLQAQVKELARDGHPNSEIAKRLGISVRTVQRHLAS